ncbi:helix-turn-helix domain-containing protein [Streptomyces fuscigenes]|uniref:helix-turn-helix domain-containing protein n=1 Tax=Streptomyces fuscigenes TaxID=1528880 RepID=UPI001F41C0E8|nr:helix-turn-helix domain-containing protein [Streptomyces fuscigenes]MCF3960326.1 helix-turn-helix domain-containing protein [Streptomyces fuscigenes]
MSHEAVTWAMDDAPMLRTEKGRPDTTARGVLQALAEHADKQGRGARPSVVKLRYRTGFDRRTVQRALRRLEDAGLIRATGTHHENVIYALALHLSRPASDWAELIEEEERQKGAAKERQRKARARRAAAAAVTHADGVTVTDSDAVTEGDVTDSDDACHALEVRDVTHSECGRHALSAAVTVREPSTQPSGTSGDGRRPTTGSGGPTSSGSAAAAKADPAAEEVDRAAIGCVIALLPSRLRDQLPELLPAAIEDAIRAELARGLTVDQLVARTERRWWNHGYEADAESAEGPGILRPVGVAVALVRRGNCTSARCDDGQDLDTGDRCRTCEREAEDRRQRRAAAQLPVQGAILVGVPSGTAEAPTQPETAAERSSRKTVFRDCEGDCGKVIRTVPAPEPAGKCARCRVEARAAAAGQAVGS